MDLSAPRQRRSAEEADGSDETKPQRREDEDAMQVGALVDTMANQDEPLDFLHEVTPQWGLELYDEDTGGDLDNVDPVKLKAAKDTEMENIRMFGAKRDMGVRARR